MSRYTPKAAPTKSSIRLVPDLQLVQQLMQNREKMLVASSSNKSSMLPQIPQSSKQSLRESDEPSSLKQARQRPWQVKSTSSRLHGQTPNSRSIENLLAVMLESQNQPLYNNGDIKLQETDDADTNDALEIYRKVFAEKNKIVAAQAAAHQRVSNSSILDKDKQGKFESLMRHNESKQLEQCRLQINRLEILQKAKNIRKLHPTLDRGGKQVSFESTNQH